MTDSDLVNIGITQKGPRLIIFSIIEKLKVRAPSASQTGNTDAATGEIGMTREWFESDGRFRLKYLYPVLDKEMVPDHEGLCAITRIACRELAARISKGGAYPDTSDMHRVATDILKVFPHLANTRINSTAPDESAFFWKHNGNDHGPHSGLVYHRVRNLIKELPKEMHRYNRSTKMVEPIASEIMQKAEDLFTVEATKENASKICNDMAACFPLHQQMLREKRSMSEIIDQFPHLHSFRGLLIHQTFERLYPASGDGSNLGAVFAKCLFFAPTRFVDIEDDYIRGALRLITKMKTRGQRTLNTTNLDVHEAEPLIRWTEPSDYAVAQYLNSPDVSPLPHILCVGPEKKQGIYYVIAEGVVVVNAPNSLKAIDTLMKFFPVFGVKIPPMLRMLSDFLSCTVYKTCSVSSRSTVNKLVKSFTEVNTLEAREEEIVDVM